MKLKPPFIITARLMPGGKIGDAFISLGDGPSNAEGRTVYGCFIDLPGGYSHEVTDLRSGCGGGGIQDGMESLLGFLGAAAESYAYEQRNHGTKGENTDLFPRPIVEWAHQNSDEISMLEFELSETPNLITP